jgi:CheY-like chemotaxis protein
MPPPKNLLLVEDEPTLQRILGSVLSDAGHHVDTVGSAEHALERLQDARAPEIDLVLSDKNLPGMNGLELLEKVRAAEQPQRRTGFMLVTGYPSRESALAVLAHDGDGYLVKPFRSLMHAVADVKRALDDDLGRRRAAGRTARAIAGVLAGAPDATLPRGIAVALELPAPLRARAEDAVTKAGAQVVDVDRLPADGSIAVCSTMIGPLTSVAKKRAGAALVLCDPGASFDDLVTLIGAGGGAVAEAR